MKIANTTLHKEACFLDATEEIDVLKDRNSVDLFDQNGYHLTKAEQAFSVRNGYEPVERRHEDCMRYDWILWDKKDKAHINHSDIFERKGFSDQALEQLHAVAESSNPMLYKLIKMKPKWGIDISIDYVSAKLTLEAATRALGKKGRMVTLGGAGEEFNLDAKHLLANEIDVLGSRYVTPLEIIETYNLMARGEIWPIVSETRPLEEAEIIHDMVEKGDITGRAALIIN